MRGDFLYAHPAQSDPLLDGLSNVYLYRFRPGAVFYN